MIIQGRIERTETNLMHFKWVVTSTHVNQPNTFYMGHRKGWQLMISGVQKALISGWYPVQYPWYLAVGFGQNTAVFSDFSGFLLSGHYLLVWLIFRYIQQMSFNILLKYRIFNWTLVNFLLILSVYYNSDIRLLSLISWYPVYRFLISSKAFSLGTACK